MTPAGLELWDSSIQADAIPLGEHVLKITAYYVYINIIIS